MKWTRIIILIAFVVIAFFIFMGGLLAPPNCYSINDCERCWSNTETFKTSEYCPDGGSCKVVPYIDQHNALIDVLNCACDKASANQYADATLNSKINSLYSQLGGASTSIEEACDPMNPNLIKWYYE